MDRGALPLVEAPLDPYRWIAAEAVRSRQKPALIMNIDIGDGRTGRLNIREGDDCDELAARFCQIHNLPAHFVLKQLSQHISRSMTAKGLHAAGAAHTQNTASQDLSGGVLGVYECICISVCALLPDFDLAFDPVHSNVWDVKRSVVGRT